MAKNRRKTKSQLKRLETDKDSDDEPATVKQRPEAPVQVAAVLADHLSKIRRNINDGALKWNMEDVVGEKINRTLHSKINIATIKESIEKSPFCEFVKWQLTDMKEINPGGLSGVVVKAAVSTNSVIDGCDSSDVLDRLVADGGSDDSRTISPESDVKSNKENVNVDIPENSTDTSGQSVYSPDRSNNESPTVVRTSGRSAKKNYRDMLAFPELVRRKSSVDGHSGNSERRRYSSTKKGTSESSLKSPSKKHSTTQSITFSATDTSDKATGDEAADEVESREVSKVTVDNTHDVGTSISSSDGVIPEQHTVTLTTVRKGSKSRRARKRRTGPKLSVKSRKSSSFAEVVRPEWHRQCIVCCGQVSPSDGINGLCVECIASLDKKMTNIRSSDDLMCLRIPPCSSGLCTPCSIQSMIACGVDLSSMYRRLVPASSVSLDALTDSIRFSAVRDARVAELLQLRDQYKEIRSPHESCFVPERASIRTDCTWDARLFRRQQQKQSCFVCRQTHKKSYSVLSSKEVTVCHECLLVAHETFRNNGDENIDGCGNDDGCRQCKIHRYRLVCPVDAVKHRYRSNKHYADGPCKLCRRKGVIPIIVLSLSGVCLCVVCIWTTMLVHLREDSPCTNGNCNIDDCQMCLADLAAKVAPLEEILGLPIRMNNESLTHSVSANDDKNNCEPVVEDVIHETLTHPVSANGDVNNYEPVIVDVIHESITHSVSTNDDKNHSEPAVMDVGYSLDNATSGNNVCKVVDSVIGVEMNETASSDAVDMNRDISNGMTLADIDMDAIGDNCDNDGGGAVDMVATVDSVEINVCTDTNNNGAGDVIVLSDSGSPVGNSECLSPFLDDTAGNAPSTDASIETNRAEDSSYDLEIPDRKIIYEILAHDRSTIKKTTKDISSNKRRQKRNQLSGHKHQKSVQKDVIITGEAKPVSIPQRYRESNKFLEMLKPKQTTVRGGKNKSSATVKKKSVSKTELRKRREQTTAGANRTRRQKFKQRKENTSTVLEDTVLSDEVPPDEDKWEVKSVTEGGEGKELSAEPLISKQVEDNKNSNDIVTIENKKNRKRRTDELLDGIPSKKKSKRHNQLDIDANWSRAPEGRSRKQIKPSRYSDYVVLERNVVQKAQRANNRRRRHLSSSSGGIDDGDRFYEQYDNDGMDELVSSSIADLDGSANDEIGNGCMSPPLPSAMNCSRESAMDLDDAIPPVNDEDDGQQIQTEASMIVSFDDVDNDDNDSLAAAAFRRIKRARSTSEPVAPLPLVNETIQDDFNVSEISANENEQNQQIATVARQGGPRVKQVSRQGVSAVDLDLVSAVQHDGDKEAARRQLCGCRGCQRSRPCGKCDPCRINKRMRKPMKGCVSMACVVQPPRQSSLVSASSVPTTPSNNKSPTDNKQLPFSNGMPIADDNRAAVEEARRRQRAVEVFRDSGSDGDGSGMDDYDEEDLLLDSDRIQSVKGESISTVQAHEGGYPVVTSRRAQPHTVLCYSCGSGGDQMIHCVSCAEPFHFFCIEFQFRPKSKEMFVCRNCTKCHVCEDYGSDLRCVKCQRGFHPRCVLRYPPAQSDDRGQWACYYCSMCLQCGARAQDLILTQQGAASIASQNNKVPIDWSSDPWQCGRCYSARQEGRVCPECGRAYQTNLDNVECGKCLKLVHRQCAGLTDDEYAIYRLKQPDENDCLFLCSSCSPELSDESHKRSSLRRNCKETDLKIYCERTLTKRMSEFIQRADEAEEALLSHYGSTESGLVGKHILQQVDGVDDDDDDDTDDTDDDSEEGDDDAELEDSVQLCNGNGGYTNDSNNMGIHDSSPQIVTSGSSSGKELNLTSSTFCNSSESVGEYEDDEDGFNVDDESLVLGNDKEQERRSGRQVSNNNQDGNGSNSKDEIFGTEARRRSSSSSSMGIFGRMCVEHYLSPTHLVMEAMARVTMRLQRLIAERNSSEVYERLRDRVHQLTTDLFPWIDVDNCADAVRDIIRQHSSRPRLVLRFIDNSIHMAIQKELDVFSSTIWDMEEKLKNSFHRGREEFILFHSEQHLLALKRNLENQQFRDGHFARYLMAAEKVEDVKPIMEKDVRQCALCRQSGDDGIEGRLIYAGMDVWIHVNCALWSDEVYEKEDGELVNVDEAIRRGWRTSCVSCGSLGATVRCSGCPNCFHFGCAFNAQSGAVFTESLTFYCTGEHNQPADTGSPLTLEDMLILRRIFLPLGYAADPDLPGTAFQELTADDAVITIGNLRIEQLGTLDEYSDTCKPFLCPVEYRARRLFWSHLEVDSLVMYTMSIDKEPAVITATQGPSGIKRPIEEVDVTNGRRHQQRKEDSKYRKRANNPMVRPHPKEIIYEMDDEGNLQPMELSESVTMTAVVMDDVDRWPPPQRISRLAIASAGSNKMNRRFPKDGSCTSIRLGDGVDVDAPRRIVPFCSSQRWLGALSKKSSERGILDSQDMTVSTVIVPSPEESLEKAAPSSVFIEPETMIDNVPPVSTVQQRYNQLPQQSIYRHQAPIVGSRRQSSILQQPSQSIFRPQATVQSSSLSISSSPLQKPPQTIQSPSTNSSQLQQSPQALIRHTSSSIIQKIQSPSINLNPRQQSPQILIRQSSPTIPSLSINPVKTLSSSQLQQSPQIIIRKPPPTIQTIPSSLSINSIKTSNFDQLQESPQIIIRQPPATIQTMPTISSLPINPIQTFNSSQAQQSPQIIIRQPPPTIPSPLSTNSINTPNSDQLRQSPHIVIRQPPSTNHQTIPLSPINSLNCVSGARPLNNESSNQELHSSTTTNSRIVKIMKVIPQQSQSVTVNSGVHKVSTVVSISSTSSGLHSSPSINTVSTIPRISTVKLVNTVNNNRQESTVLRTVLTNDSSSSPTSAAAAIVCPQRIVIQPVRQYDGEAADFNDGCAISDHETTISVATVSKKSNGNSKLPASPFLLKFTIRGFFSNRSPRSNWTYLIRKVRQLRETTEFDYPLRIGDGWAKYGLDHRHVMYIIEQLPGAYHSRQYDFRYHKGLVSKRRERHARDRPLLGEVCTRMSAWVRTIGAHIARDPLAFLHCQANRAPRSHAPIGTVASGNAALAEMPEPDGAYMQRLAAQVRALRNGAAARAHAVAVCRSNIHGRGLFARRAFSPHEVIIEYVGEIIRAILSDARETRYQRTGVDCYMFRLDQDSIVDATCRGNAARFINHSCQPNCYAKVVKFEGEKHIIIIAHRTIYKGEELTYDYRFPIEDDKLPCTCGSFKCRKYLN